MPRPRNPVDAYREEIAMRVYENVLIDKILHDLERGHQVVVSKSTLERRLKGATDVKNLRSNSYAYPYGYIL